MNMNDFNECDAARALPEEDAAYDGVVRAVRTWVQDGEFPPRIDLAQLNEVVKTKNPGRSVPLRSVWSGAGWLLTAASLCILALSLGEFRVQWGSFNFQVGGGTNERELETLRIQLADFQRRFDMNRSEYSAAVEALSNRTIALENELEATTLKLIRAQEAESATRYKDISSILSMTSRNR
ncbi:MAG: hypothetical protein IT366_18740 [Candidatus Hydrogenedentes bacterium]|nr:hypothetical protein [Candidatus Hydrogenedentota bacterium]